jgi:hypothetical protein
MSNKSGTNVSGNKSGSNTRPINTRALGVRSSVSPFMLHSETHSKTRRVAHTKMDLLMIKELKKMEQTKENCHLLKLLCPVEDGPYGIDENGYVYTIGIDGTRLYFDADGLAIKW